jgi:hypothetical protein
LIPACVTDVIQETSHCWETPLNRISKITNELSSVSLVN